MTSPQAIDPGPGPVAIDHVQVAAPPGCEPQARAFYGGLLGLAELEKPAALRGSGGAWFAIGGGQLHIGVEDEFVPARKAHPALRVSDERALEALAGQLEAAGAPVRWDFELPGVRRFFTDDPWGNRLELLADVGHATHSMTRVRRQPNSQANSKCSPVRPPS